MHLSYSALNLIGEQKATEMRAAGKRLSKPGKYVLSQARRLSDEELLTRLHPHDGASLRLAQAR
jgi:hypothetical protein